MGLQVKSNGNGYVCANSPHLRHYRATAPLRRCYTAAYGDEKTTALARAGSSRCASGRGACAQERGDMRAVGAGAGGSAGGRGRRRFRPRGRRARMRRAGARFPLWPCSRRCAARWTRGRSSRRRTRAAGTCASPAWCARSLRRAGRGRRVARARTKQAGRRCRASRGRETRRECRAGRGQRARRANGGQRAKRATRAGRL